MRGTAGTPMVTELAVAERTGIIVAFGLAFATLIATVADTPHALHALLLGALVGVAAPAAVTILRGRRKRPGRQPILTQRDQLPPAKPRWRNIVPAVAAYGVGDAGTALYALAQHPPQYSLIGVLFGLPASSFVIYRRTRRTERELDGVIWMPSGRSWKQKPTYLVANRPTVIAPSSGFDWSRVMDRPAPG